MWRCRDCGRIVMYTSLTISPCECGQRRMSSKMENWSDFVPLYCLYVIEEMPE